MLHSMANLVTLNSKAVMIGKQDLPDGVDLCVIIITAHAPKLEIWFYLARSLQEGLQERFHRSSAGAASEVPCHRDPLILSVQDHGCE